MIISFISILIYCYYIKQVTPEKSKGPYYDDGSCEYFQDNVKFGGANAGLFLKVPFTTSYPAIFVCRWEEAAGKYLKFRVTKGEGAYHSYDEINLYLGKAYQCEPGAKFTASSFDNEGVGKLTKDDHQLSKERVRVSDPLSNPAANIGCLIAWCHGKRGPGCLADFSVEFYDQYALPTPIIPVVFGLGWVDLFLMLVLFCETIATTTFICSFWYKYNKVYQKLYGKKREMKELNEGKKKSNKSTKSKKKKKKSKS